MFFENLPLILVFIFGLLCGSLISVISSRKLSDWRSIFFGRSCCPKCKHNLSWIELIPIFSFLMMRGKCRHCQDSISIKYPILEIITSLIFVILFMNYGLTPLFLANALLAIFFISIVVVDLETLIIPDYFLIVSLIPTLWITFLNPDLQNRLFGFGIYIAVIGVLVLPSGGKWMGYADLKLAPILGWLLGFKAGIVGLYSSFVFGAIFGIILMIFKKAGMKSKVAFGPFLILGFYISIFYAQDLMKLFENFFFN